jgi:hypothetical protein
MAGGGTWTIIVREGEASNATQSTIAGGRRTSTTSRVSKQTNIEGAKIAKQAAKASLAASIVIGKAAFNQYYSITGQGAQRNRTNTALTFGGIGAAVAVQTATGNFVGAAFTAIGGGVMFANQYANFQRDVADQNAIAEYLRQQSGTSISSNRGELFNFSLF